MCLSIPALLIERCGKQGRADLQGMIIEIDLTLVPDAQVGDYVLVHAGFAIQRYDIEEAHRTLDCLREALFDANAER